MLNKVPVSVQHAALVLVASLLTWGADDLGSLNVPVALKALLAAVVTWLLGYLTPVVNGYGVGSEQSE